MTIKKFFVFFPYDKIFSSSPKNKFIPTRRIIPFLHYEIFFYTMKIFLDDEKTFWHDEIVFPYIEKYFPTRWKISIYTMKTFLYNENIFLHDKLFLHLGKVDQKNENFFYTMRFFTEWKIFSARWKYGLYTIKIFLLHCEKFFLYSENIFCTMKIFLDDKKGFFHTIKIFLYNEKDFLTPRIIFFLHNENIF